MYAEQVLNELNVVHFCTDNWKLKACTANIASKYLYMCVCI